MSKIPFVTRRRFIVTAGSALAAVGVRSVRAQGRIHVESGEFKPMPIAIPNFVGGAPTDDDVGAGITGVITNNLKRSGLFAPIDPTAFIEQIKNPDQPPTFASWKQINAQALVTGRATRQ